MKKIISIVIFTSIFQCAFAQIKPSSTTAPSASQTLATVPAAYNSTIKVNFVRTWDATAPYTTETDVTSSARTVNQVKQTTAYFDGLGRPLQTVAKQMSTSQKDLVSPVMYDEYGREATKYLPYVQIAAGTNTNDGRFKLNPFANQASFLATQYAGEQFYYAQTQFEASPLNRPLKSLAPGNSWVGSNRGVDISYEINDANEVRIWNIGTAIGSVPTTTASYNAGELYRTVTTDEHGKKVMEYKDKEGKVVLKKVQIDNTVTSTTHTGWLCTYYVYDDFGLLRFVIPPVATEKLAANGWSFSHANLQNAANELCFRYEYDARHRMIIKKVPGALEVYMVYDSRDRLVMIQDAKMGEDTRWLCTKYDNLNRPILTAFCFVDEAQEYCQQETETNAEWCFGYSNGTPEILTETFYNDYSWTAGTGLSSTLDTYFTTYTDYLSSTNTSPLYAQPIAASNATLGMVTGTKTRILGTNNFTYTLSLYDDKGRPIQVKSTNHTGGTDIVTSQYDFSGKPLRTYQKHMKASGATAIHIATILTYDHAGRITKTEKRINNGVLKVINENSYNELGQLKTKKLGRKVGSTTEPIETLDYNYNIRGWLTGINTDYANNSDENDNSRWFGMQLSYDYGFSQNQYNGNIAGIKWKSTGSDKQRAYGFGYDNANRLLKGDFTQNTGGWNTTAGVDYSMRMGDGTNHNTAYDANGNIKAMWQKGLEITSSNVIDDLSYTYNVNSNKLKAVNDAIIASTNNDRGDFNDKNTTLDDYSYDVNGNLINDKNKKISSIVYNHLNLPNVITVNNTPSGVGGSTITYTYDATGNKLKKTTVDNSTTGKTIITVTDYVAGFVYESKTTSPTQPTDYAMTLQFFGHEEGRFRPLATPSGGWGADYMIKDYLGNVRMVLTDEQKMDSYLASFEDANNAFENELFVNMENIVDKSDCFDEGEKNAKVQEVGSANLAKTMIVGAGKLLKVMAGDHVNANVLGWFSPDIKNNEDPNNYTPLQDILFNMFTNGLTKTLGANKSSSIISNGGTAISTGIGDFLGNQNNYNPDEGAYLNWILLDEEQLKLVESNSGFTEFFKRSEMNNCRAGKALLQINYGEGIDIKQNGYLYIYVSNTNLQYPVYFDNLKIDHIRGSLTEETHYYPFGLTMSGISSKALSNAPVNKEKFNDGTELNSDFNVNLYETPFRGYDPQIGRFWQIDAMADSYEEWTPYAFSMNNPISLNDPTGLETTPPSKPGFTPENPNVLPEVVVKSSYKNKWNYDIVSAYVDQVKNSTSRQNFMNNMRNSGVDEAHMNLFRAAWDNIGYRERYDKQEREYRDGVEAILAEVATTAVTGGALKIAGKAVKLGYRAYKIRAATKATAKAGETFLYHYTSKEAAQSIVQQGLKVGRDGFSYLTNKGSLSGLQAQIELALPANRALPNALLKINTTGMNPSMIRQVTGNLSGYGAGGGTEFLFNTTISASRISIVF